MIQLFNVTKCFGAVTALRQVTLKVTKGEFVLLTGPSGAGKTTLLRTIFAAERPDEGQIILAGRNVTRLRRSSIPHLRRAIGVVFQDFKLLRQRTALENVAIALEIRGLPRHEIQRRSSIALEAVGLKARAETIVSSLSGGEQQRIAIARAMVGGPPILLADEPTGNLDPEITIDILRLLNHVVKTGTTVVLATHDPLVLQKAACNRIILMDQGMIIGSRSGVRDHATTEPATKFMSESIMNTLADSPALVVGT